MADALQDTILRPSVRETLAASDTVAHRNWVRRKVEASYYEPILLPDVKPARVRRGSAPVQRSLFKLISDTVSVRAPLHAGRPEVDDGGGAVRILERPHLVSNIADEIDAKADHR